MKKIILSIVITVATVFGATAQEIIVNEYRQYVNTDDFSILRLAKDKSVVNISAKDHIVTIYMDGAINTYDIISIQDENDGEKAYELWNKYKKGGYNDVLMMVVYKYKFQVMLAGGGNEPSVLMSYCGFKSEVYNRKYDNPKMDSK
jgi:hypothetical protein